MIKCNFVFTFFLLTFAEGLSPHSQNPRITIRIDRIETKLLIDTLNMGLSKDFVEAHKVKVAYFKVLERKGKVKHRPNNFIVIELAQSDHKCSFDFVEGAVYNLPAVVSRYPNTDVGMFKDWHYRLDCRDLPSLRP